MVFVVLCSGVLCSGVLGRGERGGVPWVEGV
jgi:hypothetical protein